jgi:hypothetical protein
VFWLGTDLGVMLGARKSKDASLSLESRMVALQLALKLDVIPRIMAALALPIGMLLARHLGLVQIDNLGMALMWLVALGWIAINLAAGATHDQPIGRTLQKIQWVYLVILGGALLGTAVWSWAGSGPFGANWLALKVALYGVICWLAIGIDWAFGPGVIAFAKITADGSAPELEQAYSASVDNSVRFVLGLYLCLLLIGWLGVAKPL